MQNKKESAEDKVIEHFKQLDELAAIDAPDMFGDVVKFHKKFGIEYFGQPRNILPDELSEFRDRRLRAENVEYFKAKIMHQAEEQLDGLVDIVYIALGTAHLHGWDFRAAWKRVQEKNMLKVRASKDNPGQFGSKDDIVKPVGWTPPILTDLVNHIDIEAVVIPE